MPNNYFKFKHFIIKQEKAVFKVGTDGVLLGACADLTGVKKILDAGTGTGLIALMAAQRTEAEIVALEPDEDSYSQALENIRESLWGEHIQILRETLSGYSAGRDQEFDTILTNPPYFRDSLINPDHRKAASRHAYSMSPDEILNATSRLLMENGSLQIILPYEEGTLFIAEAAGYGLYCTRIIKIKPNPEGKIIRMILKFEKIKKRLQESFLTIETSRRHHYTEDYRELMRDFYLKF